MSRYILEKKLNRELLPWPEELTDHKDRNFLNNQRENLRVANASQNQFNKIKKRGTSSQYLGVSFNKNSKFWIGRISKNKIEYVKYFCSEIEAAKWRDKMAIKLHGEFANLNFDLGRE